MNCHHCLTLSVLGPPRIAPPLPIHFLNNSKSDQDNVFIFSDFLTKQSQKSFARKSRSQALPRPFYGLFCHLTLKISKQKKAILGGKKQFTPMVKFTFFVPHIKIHISTKFQVSRSKNAFRIAQTKFRNNFGQKKS